jgi:Tol biopolymer transport system component
MGRRAAFLAAVAVLGSSGCAVLARANVTSEEEESVAPVVRNDFDVSVDGRFVALVTEEALVDEDLNASADVYVRDNLAGTTERVSTEAGGYQVAMSGSGRYVVFAHSDDLAVRDRQTGVLDVLDTSAMDCGDGGGGFPHSPKISDDGRHVVLEGTCLVASSPWNQVFALDRQTGSVTCLGCRSDGAAGPTDAISSGMSRDGRFVVFASADDALVAADGNESRDVFLRDRDTDADGTFDESGQTSLTRVSVSSAEVEADAFSTAGSPPTPDGRYVVFESLASNLVPGASGGHVYRRDVVLGVTELVSANGGGIPADWTAQIETTNASVHQRAVSDDGRFVVFSSSADNLWGEAGNPAAYVKDMLTGHVQRVSTNVLAGAAVSSAEPAAISGDARYVVFPSDDAVAGDDANGSTDLYVRSSLFPVVFGAADLPQGGSTVLSLAGFGILTGPDPLVGIVPAAGVTVGSVQVLSPTLLQVQLSAAADAATGPRDVVVRNVGTGMGPSAGGAATCKCLTVTPP